MEKQAYFSLNPWWEGKVWPSGFPRKLYLKEVFKRLSRKQIEIIVGSRRVGKTTLLRQIVKQLLKKGIDGKKVFYVSCDFAKAIGVSVSEHLFAFRQIFSHKKNTKLYLFLDEVQESPNWQIELKSLYDNENLKIFCSGSTSVLIKSHGGKLTGRQISNIVYPLDFIEFLQFRKIKPTYRESYILEKEVERYLKIGGYPESVLSPSEKYLSSLLDDIFLRDLVRLHPVKNLTVIKDLFKLVAASVGSRTSFNKLANVLGLSLDTVKEYIEYLEGAFLVEKLNKWTTSHMERTYAQKKFYLFDVGLKTLLTGKGDKGAKAENVVFWHLKKKNKKIGYFAESEKEIDFILGDEKDPLPIEVKYTDNLGKIKKGLAGLSLFLKRNPKVKKAKVITSNLDKKIRVQEREVELIPLWRFLLEKSL